MKPKLIVGECYRYDDTNNNEEYDPISEIFIFKVLPNKKIEILEVIKNTHRKNYGLIPESIEHSIYETLELSFQVCPEEVTHLPNYEKKVKLDKEIKDWLG